MFGCAGFVVVFGVLKVFTWTCLVSWPWEGYFCHASDDWSCFWCSPSQSPSTFLPMGQFGPLLHCSGFITVQLGFDWLGSSGPTFITGGVGFVAVAVLVAEGIGQSFLILKRLPDSFLASGQGIPTWTGASSKGGGCFLKLGVADSLDLLRHFLGAVAWSHCLDQAWPLLLLYTSLLGLVFFFFLSFWTLFLLGDWC